jgi:hypothetical protein
VTITRCDADHWASIGKPQRPASQEARQTANAVHAYGRTDVEWLAHVDADEYIMPHRDLGHELAMVPETIDCVALPMRERAFRLGKTPDSILSGVCRVPFDRSRRAAQALFGGMASFTESGFVGHVAGKCLVRTGGDHLLLGIHSPRPRPGNTGRRGRLIKLGSTAAVLLHLDGFTRAQWVAKILRYAGDRRYSAATGLLASHQQRQIAFLQDHRVPAQAAGQLHDMLKCVDAATEERLRALGMIEDMPIDPAAGLARFEMTDWVDLSPDLCDAQVAARNAAVTWAVRPETERLRKAG